MPLGGRPARAAAAAWAIAVLALGSAAASAEAAERADTVLVRVDEDAPARARAEVARSLDAEAVRPLVAGWRAYELPAMVSAERARRLLEDVPAAEAVHLDVPLRALDAPAAPYHPLQWALPRIGAPAAWALAPAPAPVTVAVIDEGVDTDHPDLAGRLWTNPGEIPGNGLDDDLNGFVDDVHGWNFTADDGRLHNPADGDEHGTHVAGTIAALRGDGFGVAGVADNARIMALKILTPGGGTTSDAIAAIDYAVSHGARVINASWGGGGHVPALCEAVRHAGRAGVLVVAAAGNEASDNDVTPVSPAGCAAPDLVTVAATTPADAPAAFTNRGAASVDLGAPGEDILSTLPGGWGTMSGTSMAAPHVSGAAAMLAGMHPGLAPWQLRFALLAGGARVPSLAGVTTSGRRLDLVGALGAAGAGIAPDAAPPDPFALLSPAPDAIVTSPAPTFSWAPATDAHAGLDGYRLSVDGATVARPPAGVPRAALSGPLAEGVHRWSVVAIDAAGNERVSEERRFAIDRTPPSAPAPLRPADGGRAPGPVVELAWTPAHDALTGVAAHHLVVDGRGVADLPGSAGAHRLPLATGAHTWQVAAVDAAGNHVVSAPRRLVVVPAATAAPRRRPAARLRLTGPARLVAGRAPRLRVRLERRARVTVRVTRVGARAPVAALRRALPAGVSSVRLPRGAVRRMARPGAYVVHARAPGGLRDSVRIRVARPR